MIERGRTTDADRVADLWVELGTDQLAHGSHLVPEANREQVRESVLRHAVAGTLFVAREDGDAGEEGDANGDSEGDGDGVVGFVTCSVESGVYEQDVRRGVVENLYVVPDHRDAGVGAALLRAAEDELRDRGCGVVALDVLAANESARRFYEHHGYTPHRVEVEKSLGEGDGNGGTQDGADRSTR